MNQLLDYNTYHLLSLYDLGLIIVNKDKELQE